QSLPVRGVMAAVFADEERVLPALAPYGAEVSIAAVNGAQSVVVSGAERSVIELERRLKGEGIRVERLTVSHAFHSPQMDPILDALAEAAGRVGYRSPRLALASNVDGGWTRGLIGAAYWRRHAREPVRFADGIATLYGHGCRVFVEIGPRPTLLGLGRTCIAAESSRWLPSLRKDRDDWSQMLESLRDLYLSGAAVDWEGFDRDYPRQR